MQAYIKEAIPSQNPPSKPHVIAWSGVLIQLERMLWTLQIRIQRMRMAHQNKQSYNAQTGISGNADYQQESASPRTLDPSPSQIQNAYAGDLGPASRSAPNVAVPEIGPCDTILGYEIVDGRERLIWGPAPDMPWAVVNGKTNGNNLLGSVIFPSKLWPL